MTYIEFFDKTASENISACLTYAPERVIYVGDNSKLMKKHIANYEKVFRARGYDIEFLFKTVSKSNLDNAVEVLSMIVEEYDDCVFDITGGEELLNLALGIVYSEYSHKNIQIHKFNLRNNSVYDCDKDGNTIYKDTPVLSVEDNIRIYGGEIAYSTPDEEKTYLWDMSEDFLRDIDLIWDICKKNVRYWNMQIGILEAVEAVGSVSEGLITVAPIAAVEQHLSRCKARYKVAKGIIAYLLKNGLLISYEDNGETVKVAYKNEQVKRCLTKAGQALEMKIYKSAKYLTDGEGMPVYNDALNGVVIDWDGELHDESVEDEYDTENEIDVMLMHDIVPVFISCKNGYVTSDELYKLNTVAERFGDKYSKKVLVATSISDFGEMGKYLRQRAEDMCIRLVEGVQYMDDAELEKKLKNLWIN